MANHIKRGGSLFIPFRNGLSISDSQLKPRMYKTKKMFEKAFPGHYLGTDGVELVEYAEVRHGRWIEREDMTICSACNTPLPTVEFTDAEFGKVCVEINKTAYCPNCGTRMNLEGNEQ